MYIGGFGGGWIETTRRTERYTIKKISKPLSKHITDRRRQAESGSGRHRSMAGRAPPVQHKGPPPWPPVPAATTERSRASNTQEGHQLATEQMTPVARPAPGNDAAASPAERAALTHAAASAATASVAAPAPRQELRVDTEIATEDASTWSSGPSCQA